VAELFMYALAAAAAIASARRTPPRDLDDMPGHPETVRRLDDPAEDETYGDLAEQLLDDGLADVAERLGWMR